MFNFWQFLVGCPQLPGRGHRLKGFAKPTTYCKRSASEVPILLGNEKQNLKIRGMPNNRIGYTNYHPGKNPRSNTRAGGNDKPPDEENNS